MIKKTTEEWITPDSKEELDKLTKVQEPDKDVTKETDVMDDYEESMKEFTESLAGNNNDDKKNKTDEIRALG
jgi:hypothetical protein